MDYGIILNGKKVMAVIKKLSKNEDVYLHTSFENRTKNRCKSELTMDKFIIISEVTYYEIIASFAKQLKSTPEQIYEKSQITGYYVLPNSTGGFDAALKHSEGNSYIYTDKRGIHTVQEADVNFDKWLSVTELSYTTVAEALAKNIMKYGILRNSDGKIIAAVRLMLDGKRYSHFCKTQGCTTIFKNNLSTQNFTNVSSNEYVSAHDYLTSERHKHLLSASVKNETNIFHVTDTIDALNYSIATLVGTVVYEEKEKKPLIKTRYTIQKGQQVFAGYSIKSQNELCDFFMSHKGKTDIIVLDRKLNAKFILPPNLTENSLITIDIMEVSDLFEAMQKNKTILK